MVHQLANSAGAGIGKPVSLPYREVSAAEWDQIPRAIPDAALLLASWVPFVALMFWLFRGAGIAAGALALSGWMIALGIVAIVVFSYAAGRFAPWVALVLSLTLLTIVDLDGMPYQVTVAAACYFGLLAIGSAISGMRFSQQVRRWRLEANQTTTVSAQYLEQTMPRKLVSSSLQKLALGAAVFGTLKLVFDFFTDAEQDWHRLDRGNIETLIFGLAGLLFWAVLLAVRAIQRNYVGMLVVRVPLTPGSGPVRYGALTAVVPRSAAVNDACLCLTKNSESAEDDLLLAAFVQVNDQCPVHGIDAVNALSPVDFVRNAANPWVWGEHVNDALVPSGASLPIIGLYGWGSRPIFVAEEQIKVAGRPHLGSNVYPYRVREVFNRSKRTIRWRAVTDTSIAPHKFENQDVAIQDQVPLTAYGINGYAIRIQGQRPHLVEYGQQPGS